MNNKYFPVLFQKSALFVFLCCFWITKKNVFLAKVLALIPTGLLGTTCAGQQLYGKFIRGKASFIDPAFIPLLRYLIHQMGLDLE